MRFGKHDEIIHIRADGLYTTLHRGDAIALALQTHPLAHNGSKLAVSDVSRTAAMHTFEITTKDEDLAWLEFCDKLRCCTFLFHIHILS